MCHVFFSFAYTHYSSKLDNYWIPRNPKKLKQRSKNIHLRECPGPPLWQFALPLATYQHLSCKPNFTFKTSAGSILPYFFSHSLNRTNALSVPSVFYVFPISPIFICVLNSISTCGSLDPSPISCLLPVHLYRSATKPFCQLYIGTPSVHLGLKQKTLDAAFP